MATRTASSYDVSKFIHAGNQTLQGEYTVSTSLSAGDVLHIGKIPKGAQPVDLVIAGGSGACTITVGDSNDADRFVTTQSASAALAPVRLNNLAGLAYTYTASDTLIITVAAVATGTATGQFKVALTYHID